MTKQEKQLLLIDLCARLPYGVKVRINTKNNYYTATVCEITRNYICVEGGGEICFSHGTYKPYLRPMSSMDSEEIETYRAIIGSLLENSVTYNVPTLYNFLNSKHLDYRGLIPMGLSLEAPEGMYN